MGKPPLLSLRFAFALSVSLAASYTTTSALFFSRPKSQTHSSVAVPKATAKDLLALLGPQQQALSVNEQEAKQLKSCFKFLVPFSPATQTQPEISRANAARHSLNPMRLTSKSCKEAEDNQLIWWPPAPVLELARLAVDSGGDPGVIHRALDPTVIQVPDVEGSKENRCELTRTLYGRCFINEALNAYLKFLFRIIETRGPSIGLNVSLNRFDFFHGHLFLAVDSGRLGILFHAKEYPAYDKDVFPYKMGYCQTGSKVTYDDSMNLRNILWLAPLPSNSGKTWLAPGVLVVLDARPDGIIYKDLIPEYVNFVRTLYEGHYLFPETVTTQFIVKKFAKNCDAKYCCLADDFGEVVVDVNYLNVGSEPPRYEIFLC